MTNNNNNEENIHWEESTKHRDQLKNRNKVASKLIGTINLAIEAYNNTIGRFPKVNKIEKLDVNKTIEEVAKGGGSAFAVGVVDDAVKLVRRVGIPWLQSGGFFTGALAATVSTALATVEITIDHLKDLMTSMAISGLSAEIGDLKDGQAKLNSKVDAQGKLMNKRMGDLKSELQGDLKKQGEKFEKEIQDLDRRMAQATGANKKAIEEEKKERQAQYQEIKNTINEVTQNLNRVEQQLTNALNDFRQEVNERFDEQEQKIIANKRKIEEERIKREEENQEIRDNIKLTSTNLENLRKEKEQIEDEFVTYKSQINQQTAETQQAFEDAQAEYERRTKIIEAQIEDNQETLEGFNEQLNNVRNEQNFQRAQQEEILENLQETNEALFMQQHKLNLVSQQMEEIHEEVHDRMDKLSQKLDERTNEALNIAQDTSQKVDKLTEQVQNIQKETEQLKEQIKQNKEETEKAKKEAKLANERLDNLLKTQALSDFSSEQSKIDKIQKSLELKAEETKLLATLNLLQETKKLVRVELSEINWQVGVKEGKEKDLPRPEGMLLNPNSSWAKKYTPEQLREWGWDTRLLGEHETAPLTDEEKRKEKQAQKNEQDSKAAGEENSQTEQSQPQQEAIEKIEQLKTETLTRLQEIQAEIRTGLEEIEKSPPPPPTKLQVIQQEIRQKKQTLNQKEQKVQNLAKKPNSAKTQKQLEQAQKEQEKAEKELGEAQAQLSDPSFQFEQEIEKHEETIAEQQQEEVKKQWQTIQALSAQVLQEKPEEEKEKSQETKEEDLQKKLEELVQQLKEMDQSAAASQKTMTMFLLFLIIFLLEYIVYKRNGLPGLVILNIILAVCYYHRETLKEYADLWGHYLLIFGYIMGNVLAYSAPEQEKYKWPAVIGFNLAILAIYAYTLYQKQQKEKETEAFYQQKTKEITEEFNLSEEWKNIQQNTPPKSGIGGIVDEFSLFSNSGELRTEQINTLKTVSQEKQIAQQKELEIQQQAETLQKAAELEAQLKGNLEQAQANLGEPRMTWSRIKELYPQFENKSILLEEFAEIEKWNKENFSEEEIRDLFTKKLDRLPVPSEEEQFLLSQLRLTVDQCIAVSLKIPYLSKEEQEFITDNYSSLPQEERLKLLSAGLNALEINTFEKKEKLVELVLTCKSEKEEFGLSTEEKEKILGLMMETLDLSKEQKKKLKDAEINLYNASEWTITEKQKDSLLDFGLNEIKLIPEQEEQLAVIHPDQFKTFSLTGEQKNILNSLAPLIREDKYSEESLDLFYQEVKIVETDKGEKRKARTKPWFKSSAISFLVQEEIIPDPHTAFGIARSSYLPLKEKFLKGEQRTLQTIKNLEESRLREEEIRDRKLSILRSLVEWGNRIMKRTNLKNFNCTLKLWSKKPYFLDPRKRRRVVKPALTNWQTDILLTLGFKTIPKYNFFELLIFCVEKLANQNWTEFLSGNEGLAWEHENLMNMQNL